MRRFTVRIIIKALGLAGILSLGLWAADQHLIAGGILVGALTGAICFQLLARHILKSVSFGLRVQRIKSYFFLKYLFRYAIMGGVLLLCARIGLPLFLGAACGLVLIYLVIFLDGLCRIRVR